MEKLLEYLCLAEILNYRDSFLVISDLKEFDSKYDIEKMLERKMQIQQELLEPYVIDTTSRER